MNKIKRYGLVISVIEHLKEIGKWCGETHIQKSIYFLKVLFPDIVDYQFVLYKYGPFSFELNDDLGIMVADEYLKIVPSSFGTQVLPGDLASTIKEHLTSEFKKHEEEIRFIVKKLAKKTIYDLEAISTALYVSKDYKIKEKIEERKKKLRKIKTHIADEKALKAINEVDEIRRDSSNLKE